MMLGLKINASLLWFSSIVLIGVSRGLDSHSPPVIQVFSPSDFAIILPQQGNGTLLNIRISINKPIGISTDEADYQRKRPVGRLIRFSEQNLKITKGDTIYYSLVYDNGDQGIYEQTGSYIFDGVYKGRDRRRREVYEYNSEESSAETSEERNVNQERHTNEPRHGRQFRHGHGPTHGHESPHHGPPHAHEPKHHGPPHAHFSPHGPPHHHHDPHHFAAPPYGSPHDPPSFPGPGSWKGHDYDHRDRFDDPYHDDEDGCDSTGNKNPKFPGSNHHPDNKKPWQGGNSDNPYSGNKGGNSGGNNSNNPFDNKKPNRGNNNPDFGSDESTDFGKNDNNNGNKGTDNPNVEVFTTRKPSTTQRTTTVPNIDIRFRVPEET